MRGFPKGYYKHSEEIKRKISRALKGKSKPWGKRKTKRGFRKTLVFVG